MMQQMHLSSEQEQYTGLRFRMHGSKAFFLWSYYLAMEINMYSRVN